jgi:putative membrane protein
MRRWGWLGFSTALVLAVPSPAPAHDAPPAAWLERPDIASILTVLTIIYVGGWMRLRRRAPTVARLGRLAAYVSGVAAIWAALLSPINLYAGEALPVHMVQHLLLTMLAAPLILLGNPVPFMTWGLPRLGRRLLGRLIRSRLRRAAVLATAPGVAWAAATSVLWLWHAPAAYDAALAWWWLHDIQHVTFFASAAVLWDAIIDPAPRLQRSATETSRTAWLFAAAVQNAALAAWIALSDRILYRHYLGPAGLDALAGQQAAGLLMLVSGTMMYVSAALLVVARLLWRDGLSTRRPLPRTEPAPRSRSSELLEQPSRRIRDQRSDRERSGAKLPEPH